MLSLIQTQTVNQHHWLSTAEFTNIVAISQMTPGPIGINSATYCGYTAVHNAGMGEALAVLGSFTATFALVLPSFVLMVLISKMFMKYMNTPVVQSIFIGLRPTVVGLLAAATLLLLTKENFGSFYESPWQFCISIALFVATFVGTYFMKINPIGLYKYVYTRTLASCCSSCHGLLHGVDSLWCVATQDRMAHDTCRGIPFRIVSGYDAACRMACHKLL